MPIINLDDTELEDNTEVSSNNNEVVIDRKYIQPEKMKNTLYFSEDKGLDNIIQNISGMKWTVDYFVQVRSLNDTINNPDINIPNTVQKYNRINKMIIFLDSGIEQNNPNEIIGEGTINAGLVPNIGDAFLAELTGGREAIFVVTNTNKKIYNTHDVFKIEFKLYFFVDTNTELYNNIIYKTIQEYQYDRTSLLDYSAPVITKQDYIEKINYRHYYEEIVNFYFNKFIDDKGLLTLPTKNRNYFDQYLVRFLYRTIDLSSTLFGTKINRIDVETPLDNTIWNLLLNRDLSKLKFINRNLKFSKINRINPLLSNVAFLGVEYIITDNGSYNPNDYLENTETSDDIPVISLEDETYILSNKFYSNLKVDCSDFEKSILSYLDNKIIDIKTLKSYIHTYRYWTIKEQFYYIPILLLLIKDGIYNTFKNI